MNLVTKRTIYIRLGFLFALVLVLIGISISTKTHPLVTMFSGYALGAAISMQINLWNLRAHYDRTEASLGKLLQEISEGNRRHIEISLGLAGSVKALFEGVKIISRHVGIEDPCGGPRA